jgi:hypothetical protein
MPGLTPTIQLLQARSSALASSLRELHLFPRLEELQSDLIADKEAALASHTEALIILQQHQAVAPSASRRDAFQQAGVSTPDQVTHAHG